MLRSACTALVVLAVAGAAWAGSSAKRDKSVYSDYWTDEYDETFRKYSKRYFGPHFDWRWFKAQAIAESALNPDAKSVVGAKGLMQIMPATFEEIRSKNPHFTQVNDSRWNIAAGIYYNRYLYKSWPEVGGNDRMYFTFASYNAGLGGVIRAVRRAGRNNPRTWERIEPHTPKETQGYVKRIRKLKRVDELDVSDRRERGADRFLSKFGEG